MKCLIIGYGSIGNRHADVLAELGHSVSVVTNQQIGAFLTFQTVDQAFEKNRYDYVIISNETRDHYNTLKKLFSLKYSGKILIEKPAFLSFSPEFRKITNHGLFVGYNLRFHPVIQKIRELITDKQLYTIHAYCGQYLPNMRPGTNYKKCYSSSKERGGGVLRDFSHELDYILLFTDTWTTVTALSAKVSNLSIDCEDVLALLLQTPKCPVVSVHLNYLDKKIRREIVIITDSWILKGDLIRNTLEVDDKIFEFDDDRNNTYKLQHEAILGDVLNGVCTFQEGLDVLELIDATELAINSNTLVSKGSLK